MKLAAPFADVDDCTRNAALDGFYDLFHGRANPVACHHSRFGVPYCASLLKTAIHEWPIARPHQ
jgi:hypothetical protein